MAIKRDVAVSERRFTKGEREGLEWLLLSVLDQVVGAEVPSLDARLDALECGARDVLESAELPTSFDLGHGRDLLHYICKVCKYQQDDVESRAARILSTTQRIRQYNKAEDIYLLGQLEALERLYQARLSAQSKRGGAGKAKDWARALADELVAYNPDKDFAELWEMIPQHEGYPNGYEGFEVYRDGDALRGIRIEEKVQRVKKESFRRYIRRAQEKE